MQYRIGTDNNPDKQTNKQIIEDLEALVQAVVFHYNYHKLLDTEQIANQK